jgi:hypothetical protein
MQFANRAPGLGIESAIRFLDNSGNAHFDNDRAAILAITHNGIILNRNHPIRYFVYVFFGWVLVFAILGCGAADEQGKKDGELKARLDIAAIKERYSSAESYSDKARLIFSYTLNGVPFQESHPFSCKLTRAKVAQLNWFRFQICSTGEHSIGRVLDAETQNFDGQAIVTDQNLSSMFSKLSDDSIAVHFVSGRKDLPWKFAENDLIPIIEMLGVAYCNFVKRRSLWFTEGNLVEQKSQIVDGKTFIDASFRSPYGTVSCRIDPTEKLILGIRLPKSMLSDKTTQSSAIKDVSLSLLLENAHFAAKPAIVTKLVEGEKPVNHFVVLPEEFPNEAIGKKLENWNIDDKNDKAFQADSALGAISLFFYGELSAVDQKQVTRIDALSSAHRDVNFAWITPPTLPLKNVKTPFGRMGFFNDKQSEVLNFFQPKWPTFLFVTNQEGTIQYYARISEKGLANADGVIRRIAKGENVAVEMHSEYANYFAKYQADLENAQPTESVVTPLK